MARILGIAPHLPERIETFEALGRQNPDWDTKRLFQKSGIHSRRIARPEETASDLAFHAACRLLDLSLVPPETVDYLLYCTQSPDHYLPSTACILQDRLGLGRHIGAFDYNLGCSGFVYGLQIAACLIDSGSARHVLLLTADTYSKYCHPRDRMVRPIFGDGAAATLLGPSGHSLGAIGDFVCGTDGAGAKNLIVPSGGSRMPRSATTAQEVCDDTGCVRSHDHIFMDGPAIFGFAITTVPEVVARVLQRAKLTTADVDWYVYHQANKYMLENLAQRSQIPWEKMVLALEDVGNTVSASIPLAIQRYVETGKIRPGQRLMLIGFGVGYSWNACLVTWEAAESGIRNAVRVQETTP